jgi:hypothetical protein
MDVSLITPYAAAVEYPMIRTMATMNFQPPRERRLRGFSALSAMVEWMRHVFMKLAQASLKPSRRDRRLKFLS